MSASPEVCQFSSTGAISPHCYNVSASNQVQRFLRGMGQLHHNSNSVKMSALVNNACTFFISSFTCEFFRYCTPAHNDLQSGDSTMHN